MFGLVFPHGNQDQLHIISLVAVLVVLALCATSGIASTLVYTNTELLERLSATTLFAAVD
jgi:hypothetical protein